MLTARLWFLTQLCSKAFNCAIPLCIDFPHEIIPACAVEAQIEELDIAEHV